MITIKTLEGQSSVDHLVYELAYEVARLAKNQYPYPQSVRSAKYALRSAMSRKTPNGSGRSYSSYGVHMGCFTVCEV